MRCSCGLTGTDILRNFFACEGVCMSSGSGTGLEGREGVVGLKGSAVEVLSVSMPVLDSPLFDFMLLSLSTLVVDLSFSAKALEEPGMGGVDGVFDPESTEGGLSVHIFSLSLSDSSPLMPTLLVERWLERVPYVLASGLWMRLSG